MTRSRLCPVLLAPALLLAACASPLPPTVTRSDVNAAMAAADRIESLPVTPSGQLPAGNVSYSGHVGGDLSGDFDGSFLGDLALRVAFDDNRVDGSIRNVNLIDENGRPDQLLSGALSVAGSESNGALALRAHGDLTGVDETGFRGSTDLDLTLTGSVRTDNTPGDVLWGTVSGQGDGDFWIDVRNGSFYGVAD